MKAWYSKVRDTELKDGSVRATYVVTFETDNAELKREVEKYLQGIMDRADRKTENSSEKPNNSTISKMEQVDKDINVRSKDEPQKPSEYYLELADAVMRGEISDAGANQAWYEYINHKDEPQTERSE